MGLRRQGTEHPASASGAPRAGPEEGAEAAGNAGGACAGLRHRHQRPPVRQAQCSRPAVRSKPADTNTHALRQEAAGLSVRRRSGAGSLVCSSLSLRRQRQEERPQRSRRSGPKAAPAHGCAVGGQVCQARYLERALPAHLPAPSAPGVCVETMALLRAQAPARRC